MLPDGMFALLARAVEDFQDAVLISQGDRGADGLGRIVFVNPAFTSITGFSAAEAIGGPPEIAFGPDTSPEALARVEAARAQCMPVRVELLTYRRDASTFWAELDIVPIVDAAGSCTHFLGVMRDITARRVSHDRILETERLAALGTLAAGIAHEINNPLSFLTMNLAFVEEELPLLVDATPETAAQLDEVRHALAEMREGVDRIGKIVRDVRAYSRVDVAVGRSCELVGVLDRAAQMAQFGLPIGVRIQRVYKELPPVRGDATRLGQVFLNILINAIDAIPADAVDRLGITLGAIVGADSVTVEVRDGGVGIPPDVLPRVFDPFFSTKPTGRGTGLGLSFSHGVVKSFGGEMTLESTVGVGTTVRVTLPLADAPVDEQRTTSSLPAGAPRLRVLVVDDEPMVVRSLRRALAAHHDVVSCLSAKEALEELSRGRDFHAILSDLSMPGMGGAELHAEIGRRWPGLETRVITMTGGACTDADRDFLARAVTPRFDKPIDLKALRRELDRLGARGA